ERFPFPSMGKSFRPSRPGTAPARRS
ncbi:Stage V sporulation protein SpoVM, partial [Dysosmobacter welbionis]